MQKKGHTTYTKHFPDEMQIHCYDCSYQEVFAKDLAGKVVSPGKVLVAGDTVQHGGNGIDGEFVLEPV